MFRRAFTHGNFSWYSLIQSRDAIAIYVLAGFVGATFQDTDEDVEDEDAELCDTEEEEEPRRKEPKKDKGSINSRGLLEIWLNTLHP